MNLFLFPLPQWEIDAGFAHVVARFHAIEAAPSAPVCEVGKEGDIIEALLAEREIFGGDFLGDDDAGTVCFCLTADEVVRVADFLSGVDVQEIMSRAPEVLAWIIRGGIPDGYLEDLAVCLTDLRDVHVLAARDGLCMVQVWEG
ncbi:hypothetical protein [Streptomyces sp. NPDC054834]